MDLHQQSENLTDSSHSSVVVIFCWWILRYYIPPQYYPFLKKLGDDTPELKFLGSQLNSTSLCNYCFADGLPQSKGLMILQNFWSAVLISFALPYVVALFLKWMRWKRWASLFKFMANCKFEDLTGDLITHRVAACVHGLIDKLEGLGWTSWWMAKCDLADCVPHRIHIW